MTKKFLFLSALVLMLASCGNADNALEEIVNGGGEGGGSSTTKTYLKWDEGTKALKATPFPETYKTMTATETTWSGTYIVEDNISINEDVTLGGDVDIVLCDGKTLTVKAKISGTYNLNIYAQSTDVATAGKLDVAPISGDKDAIAVKNLDIHGGVIKATGNGQAAGINTGALNIYSGQVDVTGGTSFYTPGNGISCTGKIAFYAAIVNAQGGESTGSASGGHGIYTSLTSEGAKTFTITGGTVTAKGGSSGSAEGGNGIKNIVNVNPGSKLYAQGGNGTSKAALGFLLYFSDGMTAVGGTTAEYGYALTNGETPNASYQYVKVE